LERHGVVGAGAAVAVVAGAAEADVGHVDGGGIVGHPVEAAEVGSVADRLVGAHHLHGPQPGPRGHADDAAGVVPGGGQAAHERAVAHGVLPGAGAGAVDAPDDVEVGV